MIQQIPRLAVISSFAGFGKISITAALPIISVMQVQACPLPTSILSSHLAYSPCHKADFTEHMQKYLNAWNDIGVSFDGLYLGYVGNPAQLDIIKHLLDSTFPNHSGMTVPSVSRLLNPDAKIIIDPVMGDHGKAYSTVTQSQVEKMKHLIQKAHLITPNLTEACMLTDMSYHSDIWSDEELLEICHKLDPKHYKQIVITGIHEGNNFRNYLWDKGKSSSICIPSAGASRPGTGDMFASILSANALKGKDFTASVREATDFIAACIRDSEQANIPIKEGVLFEQNLSRLL